MDINLGDGDSGESWAIEVILSCGSSNSNSSRSSYKGFGKQQHGILYVDIYEVHQSCFTVYLLSHVRFGLA